MAAVIFQSECGAVNDQWMQDIADLFQLPVLIAESTDSTLGAAMLTAVCLEYFHSLHEAGELMVHFKRIHPSVQRGNEMRQPYERYVDLKKGE